MLKKLMKSEAGFTLIELLIVVVIIGILAAVGVPIYSRYITSAKAAEAPTIMGALIEYMQSYARAHPEIVTGTTYTDWGMLGTDAASTVTGTWVEEVVGADNEYFHYTYFRAGCDTMAGSYDSEGPCLAAFGKGGEFESTDELVYFIDPNGNGELDVNWWSGFDRLLDVVPD